MNIENWHERIGGIDAAGWAREEAMQTAINDLRAELASQPVVQEPLALITKVASTAPERIYLQISNDADHTDEPFPYMRDEVTWCAGSQVSCEVAYVRADLAAPEVQAQPKSEQHIIKDFLARTGQYVTNNTSREAAIQDAIKQAQSVPDGWKRLW